MGRRIAITEAGTGRGMAIGVVAPGDSVYVSDISEDRPAEAKRPLAEMPTVQLDVSEAQWRLSSSRPPELTGLTFW